MVQIFWRGFPNPYIPKGIIDNTNRINLVEEEEIWEQNTSGHPWSSPADLFCVRWSSEEQHNFFYTWRYKFKRQIDLWVNQKRHFHGVYIIKKSLEKYVIPVGDYYLVEVMSYFNLNTAKPIRMSSHIKIFLIIGLR